VSVGLLAATSAAGASGLGTGGTAAAATKASAIGKTWIIALSAFLLGGLAGAGVHSLATKGGASNAPSPSTSVEIVRTVIVEKPVVAAPTVVATAQLADPVPTPSAASTLPPPTPVTSVVTSKAQSSASTASSTSSKDTDLAAERSLLEVARTALSRGDAGAALASLKEHEKRFPGGQLTEEREALYVQALARAGRYEEARARAKRFEKNFPGSMLLPVVQVAVE
jgi:hypothetical protein